MNLFALTLLLPACDSAKDLLDGDEPVSYCESLCEWAVTCAEGEREIDRDAELAQCVADTQAADPACAETASLDTVSAAALTECTDAISEAQAAGECSGFTGSIDEIKAGTPPAECATQGDDAQTTYTEAQSSTAETGEELCERFTETFCVQLETCIVESLFGGAIPTEITDALGQPVDLCISELDTVTTTCQSEGLYTEEEDLTDVNTARQGARECLEGIESLTCDDLFSGDIPKLCGASFTDTESALAFFEALAGIATEYQDAAE